MSFGFCGCFRPTTPVSGERADYRTQNRVRSIRKDKELDLLELNARRNEDLGLSLDYDRSNVNTYGPADDSPQTGRRTDFDTMSTSMLTRPTYPGNKTEEQKLVSHLLHFDCRQNEDQAARAIEEFMRSPSTKRKSEYVGSLSQTAMSQPSASPILGSAKNSMTNSKRLSSAVQSPVKKKNCVAISKCYEMLCGRCGKRFSSKSNLISQFVRNHGSRD